MTELNTNPTALLWLDLETTGPDIDVDEIIEVGAEITDFDYHPDFIEFNHIVACSGYAFNRMMEHPVVREMHSKNGLITDLYITSNRDGDVSLIEDIDMALEYKLLERGFGTGMLRLAGSGVTAFDRPLIKRHMPKTEEFLTRADLDIGHVRRFLRQHSLIEKQEGDAMPHRAYRDVMHHINQARQYKDLLNALTLNN